MIGKTLLNLLLGYYQLLKKIVINCMKKLILIISILPFLLSAQESKYYLYKRDTLYIHIDNNIKQIFTSETNNNLWWSEKIDGVETVYTVFSDSLKKIRDVYKKIEEDDFERGLVGRRRLNHSRHFSLDFVRYTLNYKSLLLVRKTTNSWYKNFRKANKKKLKSLKDSIDYDKKLYANDNFKNETGVFTSLILSSDDLKKLNTFYLDSTNKKFIELHKIIKEKPYVLFICIKNIGKYKKDGPDCFLFNEVFYRKKLNGDY